MLNNHAVREFMRESIRSSVWDNLQDCLRNSMRHSIYYFAHNALDFPVWDSVGASISNPVIDFTQESIKEINND